VEVKEVRGMNKVAENFLIFAFLMNPIPQHVAIIMDGNGRWAKSRGMERVQGHRSAIRAVDETVTTAAEIGIKYLTLYAFSQENWQRPKREVLALMDLLSDTIDQYLPKCMENGIALHAIGELRRLPKPLQRKLEEAISKTKHNQRMTLILALSYGGRQDILHAVRAIATEVQAGKLQPAAITEDVFKGFLSTAPYPYPELLIRTSGEQRLSNFLLWELAYAEFYITPILWPDFRREHFLAAIEAYRKRERRFGKTSEQLIQEVS
jgi:undecaprenyl diphosphate synthase